MDEYLKDLNATQAAIRAGYSKKTANNQVGRLLADQNVQAAIDAAKQKRAKRVNITQDMVLAKLMQIEQDARLDKQHGPRVSATKLLGKHIGMFTERIEVEAGDRAAVILGLLKQRRAKANGG